MPVQNPALMEQFADFAAPLVASGRYSSVGDVLQAAMDALQREECGEQAKDAALQRALAEGDASGVFAGDAFADVRREMGWEAKI
jgi:putative addiction module CopG family antidote